MKALHQRFFWEPDVREIDEDIENARRKVQNFLDRERRRILMRLVDAQNLLREETSVASFMAEFKLAWGIAQELETDDLYFFKQEEANQSGCQNGMGEEK